MISLVDEAMQLMREKHRDGEELYWILYYTYIVSPQLRNVDQIVEKMSVHVPEISLRTYFRRKQYAIEVLGTILWGYSSKDSKEILDELCP